MTVKSIKIINNKIIKNPKGDIIKFLNRKSKLFSRFGEVYFSEIKKNKTKGWNIHFKSKCIVTVPYGKVIFTFINTKTKKNKIKKVTLSKKNSKIIVIYPGIWFSFKSKATLSLVANLINNPHDPKETSKKSIINGIKII